MHESQLDPDYYPESVPCLECEDKQRILDDAKDFLIGIVEQIYSRKELDTEILDHCIEHLCYTLNVKPPFGQIQVARRRNPVYLLQEIMDQHEQSNFLRTIQQ